MWAPLLMVATFALTPAAGLPALTAEQRTQLENTTDFTPQLDGPGWYALFRNVLAQAPAAGEVAPDGEANRDPSAPAREAPTRLDAMALLRDPAGHRGAPFVMEGWLAGEPQPVHGLARPGPWETNLQQWPILLQRRPDVVALAYLLDPMPLDKAPPTRSPVRVTGRFYKVWRFADLTGLPTDYLVFVADGVTVIPDGPTIPAGDGGSGGQAGSGIESLSPTMAVAVGVLVVGGAFLVLRRMPRLLAGPRPLPGQLHRRAARAGGLGDGGQGRMGVTGRPGRSSRAERVDDEADRLDLPADPAEALAVLRAAETDAPEARTDDAGSAASAEHGEAPELR